MRVSTLVVGIGLFAVVGGCQGSGQDGDDDPADTDVAEDTSLPTSDLHPGVTSVDLAIPSGFQNWTFGHFNRGRSCSVADFDLDGRQDIVLGSPSDETFVFRNVSTGPGDVRFEAGQLFTPDSLAWVVQAADYDNDGDYDLFQGNGGIEGNEFNRMWRNEVNPSGTLTFTDVTVDAGVPGPKNQEGQFVAAPNGGATWGDVDQDGDVDLYVSEDVWPLKSYDRLKRNDWQGYDLMFINNGDGTFTNRAFELGLVSQEPTRHSHFLDADGDGDLDLYENNFTKSKKLWMNRLDSGTLGFTDITEHAMLDGGDFQYPLESFSSGTADFNNDGYEDIISFVRGYPTGGPFLLGHTLFLNYQGKGFVDATAISNLNNPFEPGLRNHAFNGVMGSTPADMNGDGLVDVYIGNGGPESGQADQLFVARELVDVDFPGVGTLKVPVFDNWTDLIDFPAEQDPEAIAAGAVYPAYPYRTHGVCVADFDLDGQVEIAVMEGGTYLWGGEISREPNRLFQLQMPEKPHWLSIHPEGNGTEVSRDAIGTKMAVTVVNAAGDQWTVHNKLYGGVGFSASTGFDVYFGLKDATDIVSVDILWPDGHEASVADVELDQRIVVQRVILALVLAGCTDDPGPSDPSGPPTRIAASTADVTVSWPDLAFAPDGSLWVSWAEIATGDIVDVYVARSVDGGATFDTPTLVDDVDKLFLGAVRQPVLAVSDDRVAVTVGGGTYTDGPTIRLYVASMTDRVFEGRVLDEAVSLLDPDVQDDDKTLVDQPELVFDENGELILNWKQGTRLESFQLAWAHERDDFVVTRLEDGAPGQPCECCPSDFLLYPDGELVLAFRNNQRNLREIYLGRAPAGGVFETSSQVSRSGFELGGCPLDGPSITTVPVEGTEGALVATWADASLGDNYQFLAVSEDRGRTWGDAIRVYPDNENSLTWPTAVTAPDGTLWTSVVEIGHNTLISSTTDLGATFTSHEPELPGGPLFYSELAAGPDGVGMIGTTASGELWYVAL